MKKWKLLLYCLFSGNIFAQDIDGIYVNLYTDSLKRGTYNYINIDGLLNNGRYIPLDSTHLIFSSNAGYFNGNSLWVEPDYRDDKIDIRVTLRSNPVLTKSFSVWIKKLPDGPLKTLNEWMLDQDNGRKKKKQTGGSR